MYAVVKTTGLRGYVVKVLKKTIKQLNKVTAKYGQQFEVLEFHKDKKTAQKRARLLGRAYRSKLGKFFPTSSREVMSTKKKGALNPLHGPISEERRNKISRAMMGNMNRNGAKQSLHQRQIASQLRKESNKIVMKGRIWCHDPITGKERFVHPENFPEGYVRGKSPHVMENVVYQLKINRQKRYTKKSR